MICKTRKEVKKKYPNGIEKLEIGSGYDPTPNYEHLDIQPNSPDLDIVGDVRKMPIPNNFVSGEIQALHIMEHFCHPEFSGKELQKKYGTTVEVMAECYRVLKPGGKLMIVTPDYEKISVSKSRSRVKDDWLQRWTVGGHENEYDVHHWLWTKEDAIRWFSQVGFKDLIDWNPIKGIKKYSLNWQAKDSKSMDWHKIEWYHWLFFAGTK